MDRGYNNNSYHGRRYHGMPGTPRGMSQQPMYNPYAMAYQQPSTMIPAQDYSNTGAMVHDNLGDSILTESIVEYRLYIDAADRDASVFPDPFKYTVSFNAQGRSYIDGEEIPGQPMPHIDREFRNVKSVRLENAILPRYSIIIKVPNGRTGAQMRTLADDSRSLNSDISDANWALILDVIDDTDYPSYTLDESTTSSKLYDDRFVLLRIKELETDRVVFSTSPSASKSLGLLQPDRIVSSHSYSATPFFSFRNYEQTELWNIKRLTIDFGDSFGNDLRIKIYDQNDAQDGPDLDSLTTETPSTTETINVSVGGTVYNVKVSIPVTDPRHPLYINTQNHLTFIIAVAEPRMNKKTQYDR